MNILNHVHVHDMKVTAGLHKNYYYCMHELHDDSRGKVA